MRFVASFLAGRDPNREAECDAFAEKLLRLLTNLVTARDKSVRIRCCQLVQVLFNGLTADELDEELLDSMEQTMMLRLEDKVPAVRAQAVKALPRLCNPGDVCFNPWAWQSKCSTEDFACHTRQHMLPANAHRRLSHHPQSREQT